MEDTNRNEFEQETEKVEAPETEPAAEQAAEAAEAPAEDVKETEGEAETPVPEEFSEEQAASEEDAQTLAEQDLLDGEAAEDPEDSDEVVAETLDGVLNEAVENGEITAEEAADIQNDVLEAVDTDGEIAIEKPKSKALTITLCVSIAVLALVLAAWGGLTLYRKNADEPWNGLSLKKDYSKYIELVDYNALTYEDTYKAPTDEDVMEEIHSKMSEYSKKETVTGEIQEGDIARIDFTGYMDGKEFEGGSGEGHDLTIGSGEFIPGFEDGLLGHKAGETVTLDLTFPDTYQKEELRGKAVTFKVKIDEVTRVTYDELTDEIAKDLSQGEQETAAEYKEAVRAKLDEQAKSDASSAVGGDLWKQIVDGSKLKSYPQKMYDYFVATLEKQYSSYYSSYNVTDLEGFMKANGIELDTYVKDQMKYELAIYTIARREGIEITDEDISTLLTKYGYETIEALLEAQKMQEFELNEYILYTKVTAFLTSTSAQKQ